MCGFTALVCPATAEPQSSTPLVRSTRIVRHRGPDDEGYLLWDGVGVPTPYAADETTLESRTTHRLDPLPENATWRVAFGHRRLAIADLTAAGHQPMVHAPTGLAIAYNGEVYNYVE